MDIKQIFSDTWLTLLIGVVALVIGLLVLKTKDLKYLRGVKDPSTYKDKDAFANQAGKLMIILGICAFVMSVIMIFSGIAASIFGAAAFLYFGFSWKKMNDEYGPK